MRIAFILIGNSRRSNYLNGHTLRYGGGGGSGTDTSTILVAEYLAKNGHEVVVATENIEPNLEEEFKKDKKYPPNGKTVNGVCYTDLQFNGVIDKVFDMLVNSLWYQDYDNLPITVKSTLIYWCHMQWIYGMEKMLSYVKNNNLNLYFVNISNWEKSMNSDSINFAKENYDRVNSFLIYNPVCDDVIKKVEEEKIQRRSGKFIFHASWARGGNVAVDVVDRIQIENKELHAFDYLITIHEHNKPFFKKHDSVDKLTLYRHLAESDYFVYPLYTPYKDVHKDTFSCVVAEAIALGAIPVTYPLGALPEIFNNFCCWVDLPEHTDLKKIQNEPLTKDEDGLFKDNIDNIIKKIYKLENSSNVKEMLRNEGKKYILTNFSINVIGEKWLSMLRNSA
jgi:glycosyltransferase involved in cell wall biosynthesis